MRGLTYMGVYIVGYEGVDSELGGLVPASDRGSRKCVRLVSSVIH